MKQLTNLIVNTMSDNIAKSFGVDIEKASHGIYADNALNRKLRRVGQEYGTKKKEENVVNKKPNTEDKPISNQSDKKSESQEKTTNSDTKEELFSKHGMLDDKGNLNSNSEHVKRMYELEKKVDNGTASSEEKKEYATLRNQSKNEKDRYVHEGRKKLGIQEDEPKYKSVEERRNELKKQKESNTEKPKDKLTQKKEKAMADDRVANFVGCLDGVAEIALDCNDEVLDLLDMGYEENSPRVIRELRKNMLMRNDFGQDIMYAVRKYGVDTVKSLLVEKNNQGKTKFMDEAFANELITNASLKERNDNLFSNTNYNEADDDYAPQRNIKEESETPNEAEDNYQSAYDKTGSRHVDRHSYGWKNSAAGYDARELDNDDED